MAKPKAKGGKGKDRELRPSPAERPPPSPIRPITLVLFAFVFLVLFSEGLRNTMGEMTGLVLQPAIGFGGNDPALTLFLAAAITGIATGVIRHFMVDWMSMAKTQETVKAFQKELRKARKDENKYKVKKLTELQPELMKLQTQMSGQQFKPMAFTMLIVVPMFAWLWIFIQGLIPLEGFSSLDAAIEYCSANATAPCPAIHAPWGTTFLLSDARVVSFLPTWILIYSMFSIPIGQLVQKGLKAVEFGRTLKHQSEAA